MINVEIGTLDKRVTILAVEEYVDDHHLTKQRLVEKANTWARIEPTRGRELREQSKETMTDLLKITIRYRPGIDNAMYVKYRDVTYRIQYVVDPYMAHVKLELMCSIKTVGSDKYGH